MEMRIVVGGAGSVCALAEALNAAFGGDRISLSSLRPEVGVRIEPGSDGSVLGVLAAVDCWLDQAPGPGSAELWLGERSYRIARWAPIEAWQ